MYTWDAAKRRRNAGFTPTEVLAVVGIILILAIVGIAVFVKKLETSREAADLANIRGAYAEVMSAVAAGKPDPEKKVRIDNGKYYKVVELTQRQDGWQGDLPPAISGVRSEQNMYQVDAGIDWIGEPKGGGICRIEYDPATAVARLCWEENPLS